MKKLTCTLLVAFLAGLATATWPANAAETSTAPLLRAGNKSALHHAKGKKAAKKHKRHHQKSHAQKAKA